MPRLHYCCVVWHHCGQRNLKKLQKINKRSLRFVFNDNDSNYMQLLNRVGQQSLFNGRVHYILTLVYKSLNGLASENITNMFSLKTHSINLRTSTVVHTHSLSLVSILLDMACTLDLTMEVNYGTPSPTPPGHYQQLQPSNRLFVI